MADKSGSASDQRSLGGKAAAVETSDPTETDPVSDEQATEEAPAGGTSSTEVKSADDAPTGGQSFDYGRRPWEE